MSDTKKGLTYAHQYYNGVDPVIDTGSKFLNDVAKNIKKTNEDLQSILTHVLSWWEEHQYDEKRYGDDWGNVFDHDPEFIVRAKKAWVEHYGEINPYGWSWVEELK